MLGARWRCTSPSPHPSRNYPERIGTAAQVPGQFSFVPDSLTLTHKRFAKRDFSGKRFRNQKFRKIVVPPGRRVAWPLSFYYVLFTGMALVLPSTSEAFQLSSKIWFVWC